MSAAGRLSRGQFGRDHAGRASGTSKPAPASRALGSGWHRAPTAPHAVLPAAAAPMPRPALPSRSCRLSPPATPGPLSQPDAWLPLVHLMIDRYGRLVQPFDIAAV